MGVYQLRTIRHYDFYEVASALQKSIRRGDVKTAGYFGLELFESGFHLYCWKRLLTISAEDCHGVITKEIKALFDSFELINKGRPKSKKPAGRIFISKAVILLCGSVKNRDADHLQNFIYDYKINLSDSEIEKLLTEAREGIKEIPQYTFDCHTRKGKNMGKTKEEFMKSELNCLKPRQKGMFDDLPETQGHKLRKK